MAVKDAQDVTDLNQDVEIIRDILFGKHLQKLSKQLDSLEEAVAALQGALDTEIKTRKEEARGQGDQLKEAQNQIARDVKDLNKQVSKQYKEENKAMKDVLDGLGKDFAKQIQQLQGDIGAQQAQLSNLIGTLASALADYQNPAISEPSDD